MVIHEFEEISMPNSPISLATSKFRLCFLRRPSRDSTVVVSTPSAHIAVISVPPPTTDDFPPAGPFPTRPLNPPRDWNREPLSPFRQLRPPTPSHRRRPPPSTAHLRPAISRFSVHVPSTTVNLGSSGGSNIGLSLALSLSRDQNPRPFLHPSRLAIGPGGPR
ncbi:hypothetical protein STAS_04237 [Striga asiatica]|uniref:Uncharacterized protein n=1 Tax=Striga asiatica TaxID=4170 RepID=A0A5A7P6M3_STRAF|nr:hypothetical protein STAS_04237 [Striga asiatica]